MWLLVGPINVHVTTHPHIHTKKKTPQHQGPRRYTSFIASRRAPCPFSQTLPRPASYQVDLSQPAPDGTTATCQQVNIRAAFVAPPGHVILAVDYRQVELRMMAHMSGDEGLTAMLSEAGRDPFKALAAGWLGCTEQQVTAHQRDNAKHMAYGLLYGMGVSLLSKKLGCSVSDAAKLDAEFKASLPGVMAWAKRVVDAARKDGFITTLAGRKRFFNNTDRKDSGRLARQAVNTVCQGSAADLIKTAMVRLHAALKKPAMRGAARLVLMVHDELVYEVREDRLPEVGLLVAHHMEQAASLKVPFPVEVSVGPSWGELQEITLEQLKQKQQQRQEQQQ